MRRWKKNWVVLYKDGNLKYFESPDSHVAEECIRLKVDCIRIENGTAVGTLVLITSLQNTVGNKTQNCFYHFDIYQAVSFLLFFFQISDSDAPEGHSRNSMFALQLRDRRVVFCAESPDDMR